MFVVVADANGDLRSDVDAGRFRLNADPAEALFLFVNEDQVSLDLAESFAYAFTLVSSHHTPLSMICQDPVFLRFFSALAPPTRTLRIPFLCRNGARVFP